MLSYGAITYRGKWPRLFMFWVYVKGLPMLWKGLEYRGKFPRLYELWFYLQALPRIFHLVRAIRGR